MQSMGFNFVKSKRQRNEFHSNVSSLGDVQLFFMIINESEMIDTHHLSWQMTFNDIVAQWINLSMQIIQPLR